MRWLKQTLMCLPDDNDVIHVTRKTDAKGQTEKKKKRFLLLWASSLGNHGYVIAA